MTCWPTLGLSAKRIVNRPSSEVSVSTPAEQMAAIDTTIIQDTVCSLTILVSLFRVVQGLAGPRTDRPASSGIISRRGSLLQTKSDPLFTREADCGTRDRSEAESDQLAGFGPGTGTSGNQRRRC